MCTIVLLFRPQHEWPLCAGANRDERLDRPWLPPAAHWPDQPDVTGGLDTLAGGTWLATRGGVLAAVLNRTASLGPAPGKRSRGELPLLALRHPSAAAAARALAALDAAAWRPFNLVIADRHAAWWLRGTGSGRPRPHELPPGLTMLTAGEANDTADPRIARHLPRFAAAAPPHPPGWGDWPRLFADAGGPLPARLFIPDTQGFGTSSTTLAAIGDETVWRFTH